MANITELIVRLRDEVSANSSKINRSLASLDRQFHSFAATSLKIGGALSGATAAFFALAKSAANYADEMGKAAQRAGVGVETLSGLKLAAELADVEFDQLEKALVKFSSRIVDAAQGNEEANRSFSQLGISIKDSQGNLKTTDGLLLELAEKFSKLQDGTQKTALAADIFTERIGARLIPLLNGGREGIARLTEEAKRFGLVIDQEAAAKAEKFNDDLRRLQASVMGLKQSLGSELIPVFGGLTEALITFTQSPAFKAFMGFAALTFRALAGDDLAILEDNILRLQQALRALKNIAGQSGVKGQFGGEIKELETKIAALERAKEDLQEFEARGAGRQAPPRLPPPDLAKKKQEELKELIRLQSIEADEWDELIFRRTKNQELADRLLTEKMNERVKEAQEEADRINKIMLEQLYGPLEAADELYSDRWREELEKRGKEIDQWTEFQRRAMERGFDAASDLFRDFLDGQIKGWDDLGNRIKKTIDSIVADYLTLLAKNALLGENFGKPGVQAQGLLGSLLGAILPGVFGGGQPVYGPGPGQIPEYQSGGIVGLTRVSMRRYDPAMFAGAGRYQGGGFPGLGSEEVPAILHRGEEVIPAGERGRGGKYLPQPHLADQDKRCRQLSPLSGPGREYGGQGRPARTEKIMRFRFATQPI